MTVTSTAGPAIHVQGLQKSYGQKPVLRGVDLDVARGSIFALLGSNGAGKTTTIRILSTLLAADAGTAEVNGFDVATQAADVRRSISLTGQFAAVDEILTGRENLVLVARLRHLADPGAIADGLLARFSLTEAGGRRVATYSGGMRRRLDIAMSLIGDPPVLFLDEPTTGLDPRSRHSMWTMIRELVAGGVTVLLTTQYLDEADQLADRIAVLDHGRLVAQGTAEELKRLAPGGHIRLRFTSPDAFSLAGQALPTAVPNQESLVLQVPNDGSVHALRDLLARIDDASLEVDELTVHTPDLDDVFFAVTGQPTEKVAAK